MPNRRIYQLTDGSIIASDSDRRMPIDQNLYPDAKQISVRSFWEYPFLHSATITQGTYKDVPIGYTAYDHYIVLWITAIRGSEDRLFQKVIRYVSGSLTEKDSRRWNGDNMGLTFSYSNPTGASIFMRVTAAAHASDTIIRFLKIPNMSSVISSTW